ncbi:MAG: MarR family transcriptional regulator [Coriobacteriaceae bacterium]|jgi:DNA-binding MarR family transcriptional regulator|nr:MarR family transcriptional regulator [Olsenella sp.]RRF90899.1 MAG: MarR family transcriptional regulator [Coriobacteriaceae bacterium]
MGLTNGVAGERRRDGASCGSDTGDSLSARSIDALFRESDRLYYEVSRGCGLSMAAYWSLVSVVTHGGATQAQIADDMTMSRQTVNSAVKSLERRGYVRLVPTDDGRHAKLVKLTELGRLFCDDNVSPAMEAEERAFASLGKDERLEFVRLVRKYVDAIDFEMGQIIRSRGEDSAASPEETREQGGDKR